MDLLQNYARQLRSRIDKPIAREVYFPLPFENYIVVTQSSGMPGKNYPFMSEVLFFLAPYLEEKGINIVLTGGPQDPLLDGVKFFDIRGQTNVNQLYYVIKNAKLSLSPDTFNLHIASVFDTPLVGLYGLTTPLSSGPCFGNKERQVCLEPDRSRFPATFNPSDGQPIASIKIEDVIKAVSDLLNLNVKIPKILHIGDKYNNREIEVVPDCILPQQFINVNPIFRMDYKFDENILSQNLNNLKGIIRTNKEINPDMLKYYKDKISCLLYEVNKDTKVSYIKKIKKSGINIQMITVERDEDKPKELKYNLFEEGLIHQLLDGGKPESINEDNSSKGLKYKTRKFLLAQGKIFGGKYQMDKSLEFKDFQNNVGDVPQDTNSSLDFFDNSSYCLFYQL